MNTLRITAIAMLTCLPLLACGKKDPPPTTDAGAEPTTMIGKAVKEATDEARKELATENINLSATGHPDAEITPAGELLIAGKTVAVSAEQRALLLEYRKQVNLVAEAGIGVGLEGADLAGKAVTEALKGIFTGKPDQVEQRIEAEAEGMKASVQKLCDRLPALKVAQDKLAASLPEFKPYAEMDQSDIDECLIENSNGNEYNDKQREAIRSEIRDGIREGIQGTIQDAVRDARNETDGSMRDAAAEAEAATAEPAK
jgi:Protein of unknown function (DUF2884)